MNIFNENLLLTKQVNEILKKEGEPNFNDLYAITVGYSYKLTYGNNAYYHHFTFILKPTVKVEYYEELVDLSNECDAVSDFRVFSANDKKHASVLNSIFSVDFSKWNDNASYEEYWCSNRQDVYYNVIDSSGVYKKIVWSNTGKVYRYAGKNLLDEIMNYVEKTANIKLTLKPKKRQKTKNNTGDKRVGK